MKKVIPSFVLLLILALGVLGSLPSASALKIVAAADLAHGESDKMLDDLMGNLTQFEWIKIEEPFTYDLLKDVDVLIIGQPTTALTSDELNALKKWFSEGNKVLWVAGDSDYGAGSDSQFAANSILETIGSKLRIDYSSVYDDVVNAGRFYRVVGTISPDKGAEAVAEGVTKGVLFHGPAPLAWVDAEGNWHNLTATKPDNVFRIAWTSENGYVADNNPPTSMAYVNEIANKIRSKYVLLAVEVINVNGVNSVVIVSGESPYGDYQPGWSTEYYGVQLDGPKFITNLLSWATSMAFTKTVTTTTTVTDTTTITETNWGTAGGLAILLFVVGLAIGYLAKRK